MVGAHPCQVADWLYLANVRAAYVREQFASILNPEDPDIPEGTMDPFIDYIAEELARAVPAADTPGSA